MVGGSGFCLHPAVFQAGAAVNCGSSSIKIADAVSIGIADEYRGETVKAFVVPKEGETLTEEDVIGFCREKLAAYKSPKIVEFRDELPVSNVGKILRRVLRDEELDKAK